MGKPLQKCGDADGVKLGARVSVATQLSENGAEPRPNRRMGVRCQSKEARVVLGREQAKLYGSRLRSLFVVALELSKKPLGFLAHLRILSPRTIGPVN